MSFYIERYDVKSINSLIREGVASLFSWAEIYFNLYNGCYHDCAYCDGKSEHYRMHENFGERIRVKQNAPHLLERYLKKRGFRSSSQSLHSYIGNKSSGMINKPKFIISPGGGVCDIYQQAEKDVNLTKKVLFILQDYQVPIHILTKNTLVLRDIDIIKEINNQNYATVNFTITHTDDNVQKIFEPNASSSSERFAAIKTLRDAGIHSGIYFYPPLPFIGDTTENMEKMFTKAKEVGAEFVYVWGLTLKPGRNKIGFFNTIKKHYPHLIERYELLFGNNNKYGSMDFKKFDSLKTIHPEIKSFKFNYENKIPYSIPRYVPTGRIKNNLRITEILLKISYLKRRIIQKDYQTANKLQKAAQMIDKHPKDILSMSKTEFSSLFLPRESQEYAIDYFMNNKSTLLENIEEEAYNSSLDKVARINL